MWRMLSTGLLVFASLPMQASDLTLTTSFESTGPGGRVTQSSTTLMIHGQRSRTPGQSYVSDAQGRKTYGPHMAFIRQCDLKQMITGDLDNQVYSIHPLPKMPARPESGASETKPQFTETLTVTTDVEDMGETKLIFGRVAHHHKIHRWREPSAGANGDAREEFTDGWYITVPEYQQLSGCDSLAGINASKPRHGVVVMSSSSEPINYRIVPRRSGPEIIWQSGGR